MSEDKTYNGWSNYETWNVNLWIDNDESSQRYWQSIAQDCWDDSADEDSDVLTRSQSARYALADRLRSETEEGAPDLGASVWADLLGAALSEVNWDEIANGMLEALDTDTDSDCEPCEPYKGI